MIILLFFVCAPKLVDLSALVTKTAAWSIPQALSKADKNTVLITI